MKTLRWVAVALALIALAWWWSNRRDGAQGLEIRTEAAAEAPVAERGRSAGRAAEDPDPAWLAAARGAMDGEREESCGPYRLLTDSVDSLLVAVCSRIASRLDEAYAELFGIDPVGEPRGAVVVFSRASSLRAFASEVGHRRVGYAGFSRATRGVVALSAQGLAPGELAPTLAHELTHLVNRRALGSDLPRWLAEGLADAIGDNAGEQGLGELKGFVGVEGQRRRLLDGYEAGGAAPLERLAALGRSEFDREAVSYDYEQSALLVRFLLLDPEFAAAFRTLLARLAGGERYEPEMVVESLGVEWNVLEERFVRWLGR